MNRSPREIEGLQTRDEYDWVCQDVFDLLRKHLPRRKDYGWLASLATWYHLGNLNPKHISAHIEVLRPKERNIILPILDGLAGLRQRYLGVESDAWALEALKALLLVRTTYLPGSMAELDTDVMYRRQRPFSYSNCPYCGANMYSRPQNIVFGLLKVKHTNNCPLARSKAARLRRAARATSQMKLSDFK